MVVLSVCVWWCMLYVVVNMKLAVIHQQLRCIGSGHETTSFPGAPYLAVHPAWVWVRTRRLIFIFLNVVLLYLVSLPD